MAAEAARTHRFWYPKYRPLYHEITCELIEKGLKITPRELFEARQSQALLREELTLLMARDAIDLWLSPSATGPAPKGLDNTGDSVMQLPWTHAGLPLLSIPSGFMDGLPVGIQYSAAWYQDEALLSWCRDMERLFAENFG